ncbi:MAG: hypothetical protein ACKOHG_11335, partial [Planctomycetia bacterium]
SRAVEWAKRAAVVGKLVKKPSSKKADALAAFEASLTAAADQLIADLKLPGELYLVRWGGTRKGAGTFYTRPQLTMPTVRRTLEPLIGDADGKVRPPEDLLALKVCDPAMGSGSFLVAALRTLTSSVVESLHVHNRIDRQGNRATVQCDLLPEADRALPTEGFEERLEAIVLRAVVEHSLYGVDIDPLFRAYGKQQALAIQKTLFEDNPAIETAWLGYLGDFKDRGNFVRWAAAPSGDATDADGKPAVLLGSRKDAAVKLHEQWSRARGRYRGMSDPAHPFRHQGSADLNTYKMFVEMGHAVLRRGGQLGLVVPSGLYTDKGTGDLRRLLLQGCRWRWLYGFENRDRIFDIHRSFKFCVTVAEKGGQTASIRAAFMRHDLEDWAEAVA